jgi:hypothetical protein
LTTAQIHDLSAEHNPYYNNNKMMMKGLGIGGLEFLPQFYDGFYIQPPGLYRGRTFLAYLFRCFAGFGNDIAPKSEELSANGSIVLQKVI